MKKWIFAVGAGVGYVLGTRAGREKYERMKLQARHVMENPKIKEATDEAARLVEEGRVAVRDKMRKINAHDESDLIPSSVGTVTSPALNSPAPTAPPSNGARLEPPGAS